MNRAILEYRFRHAFGFDTQRNRSTGLVSLDPLVRRLRERGIELRNVKGAGPLKSDLTLFLLKVRTGKNKAFVWRELTVNKEQEIVSDSKVTHGRAPAEVEREPHADLVDQIYGVY